MMDRAIVCAREKIKIILKITIEHIKPCLSNMYPLELLKRDLPDYNWDPGASKLEPRVGTFVHHPPEHQNSTKNQTLWAPGMFPLLAATPAVISPPQPAIATLFETLAWPGQHFLTLLLEQQRPAESILTAGYQQLPTWAEGNGEDAWFMSLLASFISTNTIDTIFIIVFVIQLYKVFFFFTGTPLKS